MLRLLILAPITLGITALALTGRGHPVPSASALAASLAVDECIEVDAGDTFTVAISASGVTNLMAWDIYYAYDRRILEVVDWDVKQFLTTEPNSNVVPLWDPVPNTTGLYHIGAADIGGRGTEENGSGVLAVLTLHARGEGVSWSALYLDDANEDGVVDIGPTLTQTSGGHIGDSDGDGIFDGAIRSGQIAVGRSCQDPEPTPFVGPDVIPVQAAVNTPTIATPAEDTGPDATAGPGSATPSASPSRTPRGSVLDTRPGNPSGGGSGGLSPLLATVIGAGGGAGIIATYLLFRVVRRPA